MDQTTLDSERDAGSGGVRAKCKMMTEQCDQSVAGGGSVDLDRYHGARRGVRVDCGQGRCRLSGPCASHRQPVEVRGRQPDTAVVTTSPSTTAWTVVRSAHRVTVRPAKPFPIHTCCAPTRSTTPDGGMRRSRDPHLAVCSLSPVPQQSIPQPPGRSGRGGWCRVLSGAEQRRRCGHVQGLMGAYGVVAVHPFVEGELGCLDGGEGPYFVEQLAS